MKTEKEKDTSCRKCKQPMKEVPRSRGNGVFDHMIFTVTGYRCDCGHYNDLKRRKPAKGARGGSVSAWQFITSLFKAAHKHQFETTAINSFGMPTGERCDCGLSRIVTSDPTPQGKLPDFNFWWTYSDGTREPDERIFKNTALVDTDPTAKGEGL